MEALQAKISADRSSPEYGWTTDGKLWCVTALDRISAHNGTMRLPSYVAEMTRGEWRATVPGRLAAGPVTVDGTFAKGLQTAFSLTSAQNGDQVRLAFDVRARMLDISVGGFELTDSHAVPGAYEDDIDESNEESEDGDEDLLQPPRSADASTP
ncbi:hypothetical protein [Sphingomonas sp.]|uniref:hypothetical protein n=1 Tax=Sphingomonas sp. TaxID=28214 RepID=UPI0025E963C0|nr:hypothetical protein [Sphingomonas sp.]